MMSEHSPHANSSAQDLSELASPEKSALIGLKMAQNKFYVKGKLNEEKTEVTFSLHLKSAGENLKTSDPISTTTFGFHCDKSILELTLKRLPPGTGSQHLIGHVISLITMPEKRNKLIRLFEKNGFARPQKIVFGAFNVDT